VEGDVDGFQTAHPNVVIDEETISNADLTIKVQTLAAADELPDIFCLKGQMAENFVKNERGFP
jgi:raffinose/stachyose/melibiose transport system substrate-binding protein